ncbi:CRAL/TRIO domain-containing protein [Phthorimaea operculella]|nr:CRAL/TRIO domain-containing protein [Phthorimaea operculella]
MSVKNDRHCLFPYSDEEKLMIRQELGLKESVIEEDVDMILDWFQKQPHLVPAGMPDREFVERLLIAAKGSREKTKQRLDNFYRHRSMAPELIQNRAEYIDSGEMWAFYRQIAIPKLFELKRITVLQITDPDPSHLDIEALMKNSIMLGDIRLRYDYMLGDIWVLDLTKSTFGHLLRVNPVIFSKATRIFLEGFGFRLYAVHVLGAPSFANQLQAFFSKFVKPKLIERLMFHDTVEELHKHIPKKYLPHEYGETNTRALRSEATKKFLTECSKQISDESKRPGDFICDDYLPGTFKKLDLD